MQVWVLIYNDYGDDYCYRSVHAVCSSLEEAQKALGHGPGGIEVEVWEVDGDENYKASREAEKALGCKDF